MRIAVIGTGHIGGTLGSKWQAAGHDVAYGARQGAGEGPGGAPMAAVGNAVKDAEVVVLAIPGGAVAGMVKEHASALTGKTVVDATNNMGGAAPDSRAEITGAVPDVRYVRAFNTLGWENFADPLPGTALFFTAEASARQVTEELIRAVGLEPACVGGPEATGTVDALLPLWFELVKLNGGHRKVALGILRG
ncbi:MAG: NADPH-dependent F420 reductase [Streptosporangiaceae bacterium]